MSRPTMEPFPVVTIQLASWLEVHPARFSPPESALSEPYGACKTSLRRCDYGREGGRGQQGKFPLLFKILDPPLSDVTSSCICSSGDICSYLASRSNRSFIKGLDPGLKAFASGHLTSAIKTTTVTSVIMTMSSCIIAFWMTTITFYVLFPIGAHRGAWNSIPVFDLVMSLPTVSYNTIICLSESSTWHMYAHVSFLLF